MSNPYLKLVKREGQINLTVDGGMEFKDVALGISTYLEIISQHHNMGIEKVTDVFIKLLNEIEKSKLERIEENGEV